ncbi:MAG: SDR family NAD(P)-dependent oxidoreductase [Woeseiaceae bacterium]|nr:SDR family NAD(P)-dependent oxidoreductase [Woeseiaceae bacterium]
MDRYFKGKTVIVTGGSEGVGAATARKFAAAGANLVLVARSKKNLERIAEELRPMTSVVLVSMDVSDLEACTNLFKKTEFEFGGLHVLVNNAGYHQRGPVQNIAVDDLGKMIDVNLRAPIILSRMALPYLQRSGGGAIVNVGSLAGRTPVPGAATYSATKAGLRAFTKALAEELVDTDIKVATVSPGPIDTGFIMSNIDNVTDLTFSQPISTADEVADEILKLCHNDKLERSMPPISGFLTTMTYLFPGFGRAMRPVLESKGRRVKRRLIAQRGEQSEEDR